MSKSIDEQILKTKNKIKWILDTRKTIPKGTDANETYAWMVANHIHNNFVLKEESAK